MISSRLSFLLICRFCALLMGALPFCAANADLAEWPDLSRYQPPGLCASALNSPRSLEPLGKKLSRAERSRLFQQLLQEGKLELYRAKEGFEVYKIKGADFPPALLNHLGVLREQTFRQVDEGSGKPVDTDEFDLRYDHLLVWHPQEQDIIGAYRLGEFQTALDTGNLDLMYTQLFFRFTPKFFTSFHGGMVEMGRSFIVSKYQTHAHVLALLWSGIAEYLLRHKNLRYLCGPVSLSGSYSPLSKSLIRDYFMKNYGDTEGLRRFLSPPHPFLERISLPKALHDRILDSKLSDFNRLIESLEGKGKGLPPLIKHYSSLLNARFIEASVDPDFNTLDFLICVDVSALNPRKAEYFVGDKAKAQSLIERFR